MANDATAAPVTAPLCVLIGPPETDRLAGFLDGGPVRLVLVEPDPDRAAALEAEHAGRAGVTVLAAAVAAEAGPSDFVRYNQPGLQALRPPSESLKQLLPGLRPRRQISVQRITPAELLERIGLDEASGPESMALWVDALGEEMAILEAWEAAGLLVRVSRLFLRCGSEPLVEGALPAQALRDWLGAHGFAEAAAEDSDPDWPVLCFTADPRIRRLEADLAGSARAREELETRLAATEQKVEQARTRASELQTELTDRASRVTALRKELETFGAERDSARKEAGQARDEVKRLSEQLAKRNAEAETLRKKLEASDAERDSARKEAADRIARLERDLETSTARAGKAETDHAATQERLKSVQSELTERVDSLRGERDGAKEHIQKLEAQKKEAVDQLSRMEAKLEKAQDDLGVALRMQSLAQADLQDLQARYRASEAARAEQATLLQKLTPRLQQAAAQLRELTMLEADDTPEAAKTLAETLEDGTQPRRKGGGSKSKSGKSRRKAARGAEEGK